ncbi:MAG: cellulase family glycosylhydrolase [Myxococcales bacterium]|nr:cellulase family glycosylhydrolase [Myxococcales bacterium]
MFTDELSQGRRSEQERERVRASGPASPGAAVAIELAIAATLLSVAACRGDGAGGSESSGDETGPATESGACEEPIARPALADARLTIDADGRLRDALDRVVVMRGINTGGRSKWAPFVPFPIAPDASLDELEAAAETFFARVVPWGLDTVRLPFSWEALEPSAGELDARYLDRYERVVDVAWSFGLRVIIDFHQDVYASPFCGDGFPLWTVPEPGPPRRDCPEWFLGYVVDPEVQAAFDRLWSDETGVQSQLRAMWIVMATRFAAHPGVVGFEMINEPGWGSASSVQAFKRDVLTPFHASLAAELRAVAPDVLVLYDNPGIDALGFGEIEHQRPAGDGLVYAPHLYDSGLINGEPWTGSDPRAALSEIAAFAAAERIPALLGEFGVADGAVGGAEWLAEAMAAIDEHALSSTLWEYSVAAEQWNEEDLSVVTGSGAERAVLDTFVRPWLRAVAGTRARFSWDPVQGVAEAAWTAADGITEIVLPSRRFTLSSSEAAPRIELTGDGACYTLDANHGALLVAAPAGVEVEVRVLE